MKPKRLAFAPFRGDALTSLYTVPADTTTLLKNVTVAGVMGPYGPGSARIFLVPAGQQLSEYNSELLILNADVPGDGTFEWEGQIVLNPGESIAAFGLDCNVILSGVELDMSW